MLSFQLHAYIVITQVTHPCYTTSSCFSILLQAWLSGYRVHNHHTSLQSPQPSHVFPTESTTTILLPYRVHKHHTSSLQSPQPPVYCPSCSSVPVVPVVPVVAVVAVFQCSSCSSCSSCCSVPVFQLFQLFQLLQCSSIYSCKVDAPSYIAWEASWDV